MEDFELNNILQNEYNRQKNGIELIASENFTSNNVLKLLGSVFTNKYSEGLPGKRYYGGNQHIDELESLCIKRALSAFKLDSNNWGVNVQPYSGSIANICVYLGLLQPHDRIMGLDLPSGGHLSHGFYVKNKKISKSSVMFESLPYTINENGYIDYDKLAEYIKIFQPKLLICGGSAYPRDLDYKRFREIAHSVNCLLMGDIAHISGLVATQEANNPFEYCDIVTTTTHKTLRGPRSGMIFYKKEFENSINESVFPGVQGGPHNNKIAALCHQLYEVSTPEFKQYIINVKKNAKILAKKLIELGYSISSNGTDNHIVLVNVRNKGVSGSKVEKVCELVDISINKNAIYGDTSAMNPGGIRLGSSAMTTRLCDETHFIKIAEFIDETVKICLEIQKNKGTKLKEFLVDIEKNESILQLKKKVNQFTKDLYFPI
tara:strand:- start:620 stop:1915 length:1296 start_codon:yes stop_codon:yes gene_type:complete